jgi:putative membrane protein
MIIRLFCHWAILVLGLYIVTLITPISYDSPSALAWAALVLIIVNTIIKPILILISLPLVLLSLGLFLFIINAIILDCVPNFVTGFHVPSFFWAFVGSLVLSIITSLFTGYERRLSVRRMDANASGKVIDI